MYQSRFTDRPWLDQKMKKSAFYFIWLSLILSVVFFAGVSLAKAQNGPPFVAVQGREVLPTNWPGESEAMTELTRKRAANQPLEFDEAKHASAPQALLQPVIDVWHGTDQTFGQPGDAQKWINILGNVSDQDGSVSSLAYSLNGDPTISLSMGPDNRRLARDGDFNIDLDREDLNDGQNEVIINATDNDGNTSNATVTVTYDSSSTWPLPYSIDWSNVTNLQEVVQVVDGDWDFTVSGARPKSQEDVDYDRVLAIGDIDYTDYEITVPFTVHWIDPEGFGGLSVSPGFGIIFRWQGHTDSPVNCSQPHCGWLPSGASAWYDIGQSGPLKLGGASNHNITINEGDTYYWKMRVETIADVGPNYSLKVWESSQNEPDNWTLTKQRGLSDLSNGSPIVVAHHVDLTVGDITIEPLVQDSHYLGLNSFGNGSIFANPDKPLYDAGEVVTLVPVPDAGWEFSNWSGNASGNDNPLMVTMDANKSIVALFTEAPPGGLLVSDDFNSCALNSSLWAFVNPSADGTMALNGEEVVLSVPAGTTHDTWSTNPSNFSSTVPRIRQNIDDTDFETVVKFDGTLSARYQMEGILVEQDENDMLRLEFLHDGANLRAYAVSFVEGVPDNKYNNPITNSTPLYMKVARVGDTWTQSYSSDGVAWTDMSSFTHAMTVNSISLYAGNIDAANDVIIDYIFNSASPIVPEDPLLHTVAVTTIGNGMVNKSPDQSGYACGDEVTLTAAADPDWVFSGWSGALSGNTNPEIITISDGTQEVTATFLDTFVLTTPVVGNGQVTVDPDLVRYVDGDEVTLMAAADEGWIFTGWSGDLSSQENPAMIVMDKDKTITATFAKAYVLITEVVGNGQVTADPDQEKYAEGDEVTLTAVAVTGWAFSSWSGDLSGQENPATIVMDKDRTITAEFEQVEKTLFMPIIMRP